ncbi:MAG: hypothetical protein A3G25_21915 [Betaproteobacteria bacterium RIFCSPLOWO2_12_FULL_63_13]|nr:MAG: hypothetical protein A3G25_21915 [Betaproteobacteria bacterium RIFCSPLOWO2_12_FULL_63_13]
MSQPRLIDGLQFARGAETLKGSLDLSWLPRLAEMRCVIQCLSYELRGRTDVQGRCWLQVSGDGALTLECQRCLKPVTFPLAFRAELLLAESEREIEAADDEFDRVLASKAMHVDRLVEDEVILALPMVPRHEQCSDGQGGTKVGKPSPFAELAKLKRIQ